MVEHNIDSIIHLSCLLSAVGEKQVEKALMVNNGGTENVLSVAKQHGLSVFCPRYPLFLQGFFPSATVTHVIEYNMGDLY